MRIAFALLASSLLSAQPPAPLPAHGYRLPPVTETKLPNGLTVVLVEDQRLPLITVRLAFRCGNRRDPAETPGVAAAVADTMTRATHTRSSLQLGGALDDLGGAMEGLSGADYVAINGSIVSAHFAELVDVVSDVARNAEFAEIDLVRYRQNRRQTLARQLASPAFAANAAFRAQLFGAHPYSRIAPTQESLAAIGRKALIAYRDTWLVPNNAFLIVVGKFPSVAETSKLISDHFGSWEQRPLPEVGSAAPPQPAKKLILIDKPGALQADVRMGRIGPTQREPDYFAALLASAAASTTELRADPLSLDEGGIVSFTAHVDNDAVPSVFERSLRLTAETKSSVAGSFMQRLETQAGLADELMAGYLQGLPAKWLETWRQNLESVTPEAVQAAARRYLLPGESVVVVAGDAAKLREALAKKVGRFEVIP